MSFYDLTKDNVLSASELFKYRLKRDATIPSKGGQKAFEPDGSWIHAKALENLMQERTQILGEQRVEKLTCLITNLFSVSLKTLQNIFLLQGKFWAHMGFTDKRRNWLYPEEALFLMETSTLEVYFNNLPLSIQEAYTKFMGPDLSLEEYQVFAHLRRLGYVVLRQEAQLEITPYEKQINLDKYMTKQSRKERKEKLLAKRKKLGDDNTSASLDDVERNLTEMDQTNLPGEDEMQKSDHLQDKLSEDNFQTCTESTSIKKEDVLTALDIDGDNKLESRLSENSAEPNAELHAKRPSSCSEDSADVGPCKISKTDEQHEESSVHLKSSPKHESPCSDGHPHMSWYLNDAWARCFQKHHLASSNETKDENTMEEKTSTTENATKTDPAQTFPFPSIANYKNVMSLPQPWTKLLPSNVVVNEDYNDILLFDVDAYRRENPAQEQTKNFLREEEREARLKNLKFSFAEWTKKPQIKADSWAEFRQKSKEVLASRSARTPVDHLWQGDVTPLVKPEDAWSKKTILDRLDIIKTADNEALLPNQDCMVDLKVSYCVHLPDGSFKKSMPGTPDHRVCVVKCSTEPPNLAEVQEVWSRFKDDVPLHCAVVDSGEIAFYLFDNTFKLEVLPQ
ncbi:hypothetical protein EGW08_023173 [Elysia chlorotica]|uniref:tRNA-splicing endonuclease subunit Sen54 N-terminal domain-containing protein n=1 Tax=Elysia chlorotica TaxID=188477 RepID=A0A3S1AQE2_ELYCH|nr:hypothetical protein EGW08_023173 [Elysia chlorotica]